MPETPRPKQLLAQPFTRRKKKKGVEHGPAINQSQRNLVYALVRDTHISVSGRKGTEVLPPMSKAETTFAPLYSLRTLIGLDISAWRVVMP